MHTCVSGDRCILKTCAGVHAHLVEAWSCLEMCKVVHVPPPATLSNKQGGMRPHQLARCARAPSMGLYDFLLPTWLCSGGQKEVASDPQPLTCAHHLPIFAHPISTPAWLTICLLPSLSLLSSGCRQGQAGYSAGEKSECGCAELVPKYRHGLALEGSSFAPWRSWPHPHVQQVEVRHSPQRLGVVFLVPDGVDGAQALLVWPAQQRRVKG